MQNDDVLTILSAINNVARDLDQKDQGAASICTTNISSEDVVKYNILNILLYLCSCSDENDLDMDVISDITGAPVTYSDCVDAAAANNIDSSILSYLPLSFVVMINGDKNNGVTLLENGSEEKSSAYALFLVYQLIFTRFYKNCTVDELKVKNEPLYNFLLGISNFIYENLKMMASYYNPESGTFDSPNFRINPKTGEITMNPPSSSNINSGMSRSTTGLPPYPANVNPQPADTNVNLQPADANINLQPADANINLQPADAYALPLPPVVIDVPTPARRKKPSLFSRFCNFLKGLLRRRRRA